MVNVHFSFVHHCLAFSSSPASRIYCVALRTLPCCNVLLLLTAHYYHNVSLAAIVFLLNDIYHGQCTLLICLHFCLSLPMSLYILGIFELGSGCETQTLWPNSTTQFTHHHVYDTTLQCEDPATQLHIELHEFIAGNVTPCPNSTLCFLIAKVFIPPTGSIKIPIQPVLFESQALILFPGNVNQPDYDDNFPLDTHAYIFALGTVCGTTFNIINSSMVFPMQVQEFVMGESRMYVIEYVFIFSHIFLQLTITPQHV